MPLPWQFWSRSSWMWECSSWLGLPLALGSPWASRFALVWNCGASGGHRAAVRASMQQDLSVQAPHLPHRERHLRHSRAPDPPTPK